MSERWPYDPDALARVADRLYGVLPEFYRASDQAPHGRGELAQFLRALAAPLAAVRQNIEELHADLFIDSCSDPAIALLADMVGVSLLFPEATANRIDVRNTVRWRRGKGTPAMLAEMGGALTERLSVLTEGWRLVAMTQDVNHLRLDRGLPDARDARLRERSGGPLDAGGHVVDVRAIGAARGGYHPRHATHWVHLGQFFTVSAGEAAYVGSLGEPVASSTTSGTATDTDWRYAFDPLGADRPLRARRVSSDDDLRTDRIGAMAFAREPGAFFGRDGRFTVNIAGLPAAVVPAPDERGEPALRTADASLLSASVVLDVLDHPGRRFSAPIQIAVCAVPVPAAGAAVPTLGQAQVRASVELDGNGPRDAATSAAAPPALSIPMIRLRPVGAPAAFFPGATIGITGGAAAARRAHPDPELAVTGQLRGAIAAELPPRWIVGDTWLYVTADGTTAAAQGGDGAVVALDRQDDRLVVDRSQVARVGIGPVWPRLALSADAERLADVLPAPERGPAVLHGGHVVASDGSPAPASRNCRLVVAAVYDAPGPHRNFELIGALAWQGPDPNPATKTWSLLDEDGAVAAEPSRRFGQLIERLQGQLPGLRLGLRFVADGAGVMTPAEVSWAGLGGDALLVHLPELATAATPVTAAWIAGPSLVWSEVVVVARDGATWWETGGLARMATSGGHHGWQPRGVAPLVGPVFHRRRQVRGRTLCGWRNETDVDLLAGTPAGFLDVDVEHGLFALAKTEPPQVLARNSANQPVPNVTVEYQEGATLHVGALPGARGPVLGAPSERPTRLVSRTGVFPLEAPHELAAVPRYTSLQAAMTAVAASTVDEVVEIVDSATYVDDLPAWPAGPPSLTLQARDGARPVILLRRNETWTVPAVAYTRLVLRGIALGDQRTADDPRLTVPLPPARDIELALCSVVTASTLLSLQAPAGGTTMTVRRCRLAPMHLQGTGTLTVTGSVLDVPGLSFADSSLDASGWTVDVDRSTVLGRVEVRTLEASESIFLGRISVADRFHGCIRYCRVESGSLLPQQHRLASGTPVLFVSVDRNDPAYARLAERCAPAILRGAADGGEMGAFHDALWSVRYEAFLRRLDEFSPAGLETGVVRVD